MPVDRDQPIDRDRVVRTALALLDEVGLENLTVRRIADRLNVKAPALYWHFKNKRELLDAMATTVLMDSVQPLRAYSTESGPLTEPGDWRRLIPDYAHGLRAALLKYRDGAKMVPGTYLTDTSMYAVQEATLRVFLTAGFTADQADTALGTVYNFTVGFAIEEQAMYPRPGKPDTAYAPENRLSRIDPQLAPTVAELAAADRRRATGEKFDNGLAIIMAGIESLLTPPRTDG